MALNHIHLILGNVIHKLSGICLILFLRNNKQKPNGEQVLWMTMVLPTFAETKVGRTEGLSNCLTVINRTPL